MAAVVHVAGAIAGAFARVHVGGAAVMASPYARVHIGGAAVLDQPAPPAVVHIGGAGAFISTPRPPHRVVYGTAGWHSPDGTPVRWDGTTWIGA